MIAPSDLERHLADARTPSGSRFASWLLRRREKGKVDHGGADAPIVLRAAADADAAVLERLTQLDGHGLPQGHARILAESRGRVIAAADVVSGTTISDPFVPTAAAVALLRLRAAQLR